ncbi:tetratricopeptide repeat protein [bacterium]|nr:tetratricopeptide repeat protein [bacterium]
MSKTIVLILSAIMLFACSSSEKNYSRLNERYILNSVDDQLPPNLWSPRRRTSASYYHYLVADISMLRGDLGSATQNYNASYALKPNSFSGAKLVTAHALSGNKVDSLSESRRMVLLYPKSSSLRVLYGDVLYSNGDMKKAAVEFEKAISLDKSNEKAYTSVISVYAALKKFKKALKVAGQYKKNLASSANAWLSEAKIKLNLKDYKGALKSIKVAYGMQSSNSNILLVYAFCLEKNKDTKNAIKHYEKLFRVAPNSLEIAGKLVGLYQDIGGLEEAYDVLNGISKRLKKTTTAVELQKIFILWELKKFDEAVALSVKLSSKFPKDEQVTYITGYSYLLSKNDEMALARFSAIPKESMFRPNSIIYASEILRRLDRTNEAVLLVDEFKAMGDLKPAYISYAADFFVKMKSYPRAIEFLVFGYERFPKSYNFLFLTGVYHEKLGDVDKSIEAMKKLIKLSPDHAAGLNFLGYIYAELGINLEEAEDYLVRALAKNPTNGFYLDSLGWVYFKLGQYKKAEQALLKAAKSQPNEGVIYEHLAEIEIEREAFEKAFVYFEKALKARLSPKDRDRVKKRYHEVKASNS